MEACKTAKKTINERANQSGVTVSKDGKTIYFTSDRSGGIGGLDIYVTTINNKGKWTKPTNLGTAVNTPLNEEMVMLSHDERYLYFSSEGYETIGGSDIYVWEIGSNEPPKNLGYPINDAYNNNFYFPIDSKTGLISVIKPEGQGQMDIYEVSIHKSYEIQINIIAENNVDNDTPITLQIENLSREKLYSSNIPLNTINNIGKFLPGKYNIIIHGDEIFSINEQIEITSENKRNIVSLNYNIKSSKSKEEPKIADVKTETKQEIIIDNKIIEKKPETLKDSIQQTSNELAINNSQEITLNVKLANSKTTNENSNKPSVSEFRTTDDNKKELKQEKNSTHVRNEIKTIYPKEDKKVIIPEQTRQRNGNYTIQFMALDLPVINKDISDMGNINIFYSSGELYKYTTGIFESKESAAQVLEKVHLAGYPQAFVTEIPLKGKYAIQLIALKNPREVLEVSDSVSEINMMYGNDGFYRYFIGGFKTYEQAQSQLSKVKNMAHPQAFIREIPQE